MKDTAEGALLDKEQMAFIESAFQRNPKQFSTHQRLFRAESALHEKICQRDSGRGDFAKGFCKIAMGAYHRIARQGQIRIGTCLSSRNIPCAT
ncbi:MAG: hypothetical protein MR711_04690 [Selenomonas sp.]|nr:hypothetical protein [Selenomonas sp.]MCI6085536.1 hypothetical protein [Selenomonas sp.]MDY3296157.1 hypothetical protein [Selenomonas sp.]MDY4416823.1 hypothetical protein [Selenomonas sp.]